MSYALWGRCRWARGCYRRDGAFGRNDNGGRIRASVSKYFQLTNGNLRDEATSFAGACADAGGDRADAGNYARFAGSRAYHDDLRWCE